MSHWAYLAKSLGKNIANAADTYDYNPESKDGNKHVGAGIKGGAMGVASLIDTMVSLLDLVGNTYGYTVYGKGKSLRPFEEWTEKGIDWLTNDAYADKNLTESEKKISDTLNIGSSFLAPLGLAKAAKYSPTIAKGIAKYNKPVEMAQKAINSKITNKYGKGLTDFVAEMSKLPTKDAKISREVLLKFLPAQAASKLASENIDQDSMLGRFATAATPLATSAAQRSVGAGTKKYINTHIDPQKVKLFEKLGLNPDLGSILSDESLGAAKLKQMITALGQGTEGSAARLNTDKFLEDIGQSVAGRTKGNLGIESATDNLLSEATKYLNNFHSKQQEVRNPIREKIKTDDTSKKSLDAEQKFLNDLAQSNPKNFKQYSDLIEKNPNDKTQLLEMFGFDPKKGSETVNDPKAFNMQNTYKVFQDIRKRLNKSLDSNLEKALEKPIDFNDFREQYDVLQSKNHPDSSKKVLDKNKLKSIRDAVNADFKENMERLNLNEDLAKWVKSNEDYTNFFSETSRKNWDEYKKHTSSSSPEKRVNFLENELLDQKFDKDSGKPKKRIVDDETQKSDTPALNRFAGEENFKNFINELIYSKGYGAGDKFNASRFFNYLGKLDKDSSLPVFEHFWKKANPDVKGSLKEYEKALLNYKNAQRTQNTSMSGVTSDTFNTIDNMVSAPVNLAMEKIPTRTISKLFESLAKTMLTEEGIVPKGGLKELVKEPTLESYLPTAKNIQSLRKLVKNKNPEKEEEYESNESNEPSTDPLSFW